MTIFSIVVVFNVISIIASLVNIKKARAWLIGSCALDVLVLFCIMQANELFKLYS